VDAAVLAYDAACEALLHDTTALAAGELVRASRQRTRSRGRVRQGFPPRLAEHHLCVAGDHISVREALGDRVACGAPQTIARDGADDAI